MILPAVIAAIDGRVPSSPSDAKLSPMPALSTSLLPTLALDWNQALVGGLMVLFISSCILLILAILVQRPQGGGLAGAFGSGSGSGQTAFGARTGDALTVITISMFVLYLVAGLALGYAAKPVVAKPQTEAVAVDPAAADPAAATPAATDPAAPVLPAPPATPAPATDPTATAPVVPLLPAPAANPAPATTPAPAPAAPEMPKPIR